MRGIRGNAYWTQGKSEKTLRAYNYRLGFFLDFTVQQNLRFLDQIDRNQLLRYVTFFENMTATLMTARFTTSSKP